MIQYLYMTVFYKPLYNGLVFLLAHLPQWADAGVAVILSTLMVKLILYPLSKSAIKTQIRMKELEPKIAEIKAKYKDNLQEQSVQTMQLYRQYKIKPFSGFLLILLQIPIIIALYRIFLTGGLPAIHLNLLYTFILPPSHVNMNFLGIDIAKRSIILAVVAALSQFVQVRFSIPEIKVSKDGSFKNDFARTMNMQMRYILPVFVFFIAISVNAAIALYWITSNIFAICQELFVRRRLVGQADQLKADLIIK